MPVLLYRKNDFAKVSKNLARYRFENKFIGLLKWLRGNLKHDE